MGYTIKKRAIYIKFFDDYCYNYFFIEDSIYGQRALQLRSPLSGYFQYFYALLYVPLINSDCYNFECGDNRWIGKDLTGSGSFLIDTARRSPEERNTSVCMPNALAEIQIKSQIEVWIVSIWALLTNFWVSSYGYIPMFSKSHLLHHLTPCSSVLLDKPPVFQLLKDLQIFHGNRWFITVFTRGLHWSLPLDR
jgi:hypothetical protein